MSTAKAVMALGVAAVWVGAITDRPGLTLLGVVLIAMVGVFARAQMTRGVEATQ
jgi:hypothetical protein